MSADIYLNVATDGFLSSLLIPIHSQTSFFALKAFGAEPATLYTAAAVAVVSAVAGHLVNYGIGRLIYLLCVNRKVKFLDSTYGKLRLNFIHYGIVTLLGSWITLFSVFSVIAGFFGARLRYVALLLFIGQAGYYIYALQH